MNMNSPFLRAGDAQIVLKLDRLGRDPRHLVNVVDALTKRNIGLKGVGRRRCVYRYHDRKWSIGVRDLYRLGRVRAGSDCGTDKSWTGSSPRTRPQWRSPLQDDTSEAMVLKSLNGTARDKGG